MFCEFVYVLQAVLQSVLVFGRVSKSRPIGYTNTEKYTQLGLNIAYYRKLRGMTQEQLAEKVGDSRSHLSAIEAPNVVKAFSIELLFEIADALQVDSYKLLMFKE